MVLERNGAARLLRVAPDVSLLTFDRAREPKKLVILNGVDHHAIYELPARTDLLATVLPWLKEHLNRGEFAPK